MATTVLEVALPWPDKALSPNARVHWRRWHAAAKSYKRTAWVMARHALQGRQFPAEGPISVRLVFRPPNLIRRDVDNMLASLKPAIDGISLAIGVDDTRFAYALERQPPVKGGRVIILVRAP
jgi:crossover junction endodeoxyribonuclease RusA